MKWQSMTRYFVILLNIFIVTLFMINDFKNKYQFAFGFDKQESGF